MATLTVQTIPLDNVGALITFSAAAGGGDDFVNPKSGKGYLRCKNADASATTVTVNSQKNCDQGFDHDIALVVPAGETREIGPLSPDRFDDTTRKVLLTYSSVTSLTIAVVETK